jgi:hypothetical protein
MKMWTFSIWILRWPGNYFISLQWRIAIFRLLACTIPSDISTKISTFYMVNWRHLICLSVVYLLVLLIARTMQNRQHSWNWIIIWKGCGVKWPWPNWRKCSGIYLQEVRTKREAQSVCSVFRPLFEPATSKIQVRNCTAWACRLVIILCIYW